MGVPPKIGRLTIYGGESTGMPNHVNIANKSYRRTLPMTNYQNYKHLLQGSLKSLSERS